ncbi:TlpA disulfide reductase family protein [Sphingobium aquiterrae]|uniref:TlpA family protein disulfide reductase n=1 Tax=Sphingobium aquiterrae TaxID=2038656 RepID=UPI003015D714
MALLIAGGVLSACDRQSAPQGQHANASAAAASDEVPSSDEASGSAGAPAGNDSGGFSFTVDKAKAGTPAPAFVFAAPGGGEAKLADFAGKPILVNLWATWCAPCVAEMPTLDTIAATYAPRGLQILTISQDSQGAERVDAFFAARKFKHLKAWRDPENQFGFHYATGLLPTSVLYNARGKEVARVTGAMDWTGPEAKALIEEALKGA